MKRQRLFLTALFLLIIVAILAFVGLRSQQVQISFVATATPTAPLPLMQPGDVWTATEIDHNGVGGTLRVKIITENNPGMGATWYLAPEGTAINNVSGTCALRMTTASAYELSLDPSQCIVS